MGLTSRTVEFDVSDLEIGSLLEYSGSDLEEGHQQRVLDEAQVDSLGGVVFEVLENRVFVAEKHQIFKLIHAREGLIEGKLTIWKRSRCWLLLGTSCFGK
jgi:hypothetical protein